METTTEIDLDQLAAQLSLSARNVRLTAELLDAGNTVPFITRYRREQTGGLDEPQIRSVQSGLERLRSLAERKQTILRSIESQGKLTTELSHEITIADSVKRLEDLYLPFKPRKQTLSTIARQRGLEPLAHEILAAHPSCSDVVQRAADFLSPERTLVNFEDVLSGVGHILAERFGERADVRGLMREIYRETGEVVCSKIERPVSVKPVAAKPDAPAAEVETGQGGEESTTAPAAEVSPPVSPPASPTSAAQSKKAKKRQRLESAFKDYFEFREKLTSVPPHRILAINRGERAKVLRVKIESDTARMIAEAEARLVAADHPHGELLRQFVRDAATRLILPALEREVRRELTEAAEQHAVGVFARNLRKLLLQPPVSGRRVLAIDPGLRNGCKLAALDEFGNVVGHGLIHVVGNEQKCLEGRARLAQLMTEHQLELIAIGNGAGGRETERLIADMIQSEWADRTFAFAVVNQAGTSVYSASALGREELPDCDVVLRGAVSVGRRLLDPLSELVKINPSNIGVGMYQHDVKARHLRDSLDGVVESCVNYVGVDVNTASPSLLRYVSGLNQLTARRLYEYRCEHGPFRNREQFHEVAGFGETTFVQAAGFLKIRDGDNGLDATWIHPESYAVAQRVLELLGTEQAELSGQAKDLEARIEALDVAEAASRLGIGSMLLADILTALARSGRDPRDEFPAPVFRRGIMKLEDLEPGMRLAATVLNVVDFGAFVDIGLADSGLVHISRLADRFVRDPHEILAVGDLLDVWVTGVDRQRRRVSLTAIAPGTETVREAARPRRGRKTRRDKPSERRRSGGRGANEKSVRPPKFQSARPKKKVPAKPITKEMEEGSEPMRSFSDLLQFYEKKKDEPDPGT